MYTVSGIAKHHDSAQNGHVGHGLCRYLSGVKLATLPPDYASIAFEEIANHSSKGNLHYMLNVELLNLKKVGEVKKSAMAFNARNKSFNAMTLCTWEEDTKENEDVAREAIHSLTNIFKVSDKAHENPSRVAVYGNYGA